MPSHPRISELLVACGGYKDLETPVILTSGKVGIYYINTEKLAKDGGKFNDYGESSRDMINHAIQRMEKDSGFAEVFDIILPEIDRFFPKEVPREKRAISGGQRRDWLFSGVVAQKLGYPHISLYKDGRREFLDITLTPRDIEPVSHVVHVADLLTMGSSAYDPRKSPPTGWVPMLRNGGHEVNELVTIVTRLQGGEDALAKAHVGVTSFVQIDEEFLRNHSKQPKVAVDYVRDPDAWAENYLRTVGVDAFVDAFGPKAKDDRALKFLRVYEKVLYADEAGLGVTRKEVLRRKVLEKYEFDINTLNLSGIKIEAT